MTRKIFLCFLLVGMGLLGGIFFLKPFAKGCNALPLGEVLGKDFEDTTGEISDLLGDFPELKARTTLVTCVSTYDIIYYVEVQAVQLWIKSAIWERWKTLRNSNIYMMEITLERMIPIWRDMVQKFLPPDLSYLYWTCSLENGWRVSIVSTSRQQDTNSVPVLVVFRKPKVR